MMDLSKVKFIVKKILEEQPKTRDDDNLLILKVWAHQYPKLRDNEFTFVQFSHRFLAGKFHSTESIRRCRQKWQEQEISLRGKNYKDRHTKESESVKQQMIEWKL